MRHNLLLSAVLAAGVLASIAVPARAASQRYCHLRDAAAPAPSVIYAICEQGQFYSSTDGGANWNLLNTNASEPLRATAFLDAKHGVVVGAKGLTLTTADGGNTWAPSDSGTGENLLSVYASGGELWASGYNGTILHSTDGGRTWSKQLSGITQALESIYFRDATHGWAVGWSGAFLRTADGGRTWLPASVKNALWTLSSVAFRDLKDGWAVGFSGQLFRSRDGGATWEAQKSPSTSWLTSVAVDSSGRVWLVSDSRLYVSLDGNGDWQSSPVRDRIFLAKAFAGPDSLLAVGSLGLMKQGDSGYEWKHIPSLVPAGMAVADPAYVSPRRDEGVIGTK